MAVDETPRGNRAPAAFPLDAVIVSPQLSEPVAPPAPEAAAGDAEPDRPRLRPEIGRGLRWGAILVSALTAAASLAAGLWFYHLVAIGLWRDDWVGIALKSLLAVAGAAVLVLVLREVAGLMRLRRIGRLKKDIADAMAARSVQRELLAVRRLMALYRGRPDLAWPLARLDEHMRDIHDPGAVAALADRWVMTVLDNRARQDIAAAVKRVGTVTALSPIMTLSVAFLAFENVRMLRRLAALYGGSPGFVGGLRLAKKVVVHLVAAGSVALTDDLLGQFVGQDVVRRLSRRLGEGAFNGALTARMGVAAIDVMRPIPFIEAKPVRARSIFAGIFPGVSALVGR